MIWILICLHLIINFVWLWLDKTPPFWDQAFHLKSVVLINHFLTDQFWGNFSDLIRSFYAYPPLIYFLTGISSLITGLGISRITYVNSLFFGLSLFGLYLLSLKILKRQFWAFLATLLFSLMPVIYDTSRNFLLDIPLLTWVIWGLYFFVDSRYLTKTPSHWLWLLTLILASLTKLNGPLYYLPMVFFALFYSYQHQRLKPLVFLFTGGLIWTGLVGWWYFINWQNITLYLTGLAGQGEPLTDPSGLLNLANWIHYFKLFFLHQFSPIATLLILLSFLFWPRLEIDKNNRRLLLFYLIFNYALFTLIKNKDFRFTFPLLPIIAILATANLRHAPKVIMVLLFTFLGFYFVNNSFSWPIKKPLSISSPTFILGNVEWISLTDYPVRSPKQDAYPNLSITNDLDKLAKSSGQRLQVLVLIDQAEVNDGNLQFYQALIKNYQYEISSLKDIQEFKNKQEIKNRLESYDLFLVPEKNLTPAPFYAIYLPALTQARDYLWNNQKDFRLVNTYDFQTKKLYLFSR
jgi:hypothetical protein